MVDKSHETAMFLLQFIKKYDRINMIIYKKGLDSRYDVCVNS